jgi:poly(hydroxyalkanoate) depolymerase family esterase
MMLGLGDTLADLAARRMPSADGLRQDAGMSDLTGYSGPSAGLRMLLYRPASLKPGAPVVVLLHGCTQRAGSYAEAGGWLTLADRLGFLVLAPEQSITNNPNRCFNWFETARADAEAAAIHAALQHVIETHQIDRRRVFVTGLSAGGAMAAVMLATYPATFAAGAVVAGLPVGTAEGVQQALATMRRSSTLASEELKALVAHRAEPDADWPRLTIWHGDADMTVSPGNAEVLASQWSAVLGLAEPDRLERFGRVLRTQWLSANGDILVETNLVSSMGHGTPLATGGEDPIGQVAPFMIEVGASSTLEIAHFWGLMLEPARPSQPEALRRSPRSGSQHDAGLGERVMSAVSAHVPPQVGKVINDALRAAGLMK